MSALFSDVDHTLTVPANVPLDDVMATAHRQGLHLGQTLAAHSTVAEALRSGDPVFLQHVVAAQGVGQGGALGGPKVPRHAVGPDLLGFLVGTAVPLTHVTLRAESAAAWVRRDDLTPSDGLAEASALAARGCTMVQLAQPRDRQRAQGPQALQLLAALPRKAARSSLPQCPAPDLLRGMRLLHQKTLTWTAAEEWWPRVLATTTEPGQMWMLSAVEGALCALRLFQDAHVTPPTAEELARLRALTGGVSASLPMDMLAALALAPAGRVG